MINLPELARFMRFVMLDRQTCCWEWTGAIGRSGYAVFTRRSKAKSAHRISWELHCGAIPDGLCVLHRCDNRKCVNPSHLFLGTHKDNTQDAVAKGRMSRGDAVNTSRLTERQVRVIRARCADGASYSKLARRFGVTHQAVRSVALRLSWAHI